MKRLIYPALMVMLITASAFTLVPPIGNWKVKEEAYVVLFKSRKVNGIFKGLKTDIQFDENNLSASSIRATIDATSINTGNGLRNKHARQGLAADQYPTITFVSTAIVKKGSGYEAQGKLTLRDVTKDIKIPFTFTRNAEGGVFEGTFPVVTAEYHVEKNGTPEQVDVQLTVPVLK